MGSRPQGWFCSARTAEEYEAVFEARAAAGEDMHGEARFVLSYRPSSVLDAGCGTGRVARELARHGVEVAGVDNDAAMLAVARDRAPHLMWHEGDLATVDLGRRFDLVVLAGNVMIFLAPGSEAPVVGNMARHLAPGGLLVAGFQLGFGLASAEYDRLARASGLQLVERFAGWNRELWQPDSRYLLTVHRAPEIR